MTVSGPSPRYEGTLELGATPRSTLTIDAASLDTGNARRDKHLRSEDFFDVEHHPQVRFTSTSATVEGDRLKVRGRSRPAASRSRSSSTRPCATTTACSRSRPSPRSISAGSA